VAAFVWAKLHRPFPTRRELRRQDPQGCKPGDLPIQLPTKFEFVIDSKTAKALGLTIARSLVVLADEDIQ
jgi:hypothetical protein